MLGPRVGFAVAYVLRLYVNLFIEPTFNPLKHFPTVTVAAKIMCPSTQPLIQGALGGPRSSACVLGRRSSRR